MQPNDDTYGTGTGPNNFEDMDSWKPSKQGDEENKGEGENDPYLATLEKKFVPTILDIEFPDYIVQNPQLTSSHISYLTKGIDRQGNWEGQRRYSHFHALHDVLRLRWPGIVIPRIPPKKAIVNIYTIVSLNLE